MATFRYDAYDQEGALVRGSVEAASRAEASDALLLQGLTAFQVRAADESATPWWQREIFSDGRSLRNEVTSLTRELATLIGAEIRVDEALRIVSDQAATARLRAVTGRMLADVRNGAPLSEAMQRHPRLFGADYVSIVRAGEVGGTVSQVFEELAGLLERRRETRGRIESALIYPLILVALSLVTLGIVVGVLVPTMASTFAERGRAPPPALQFLVSVQSTWPEILAGLAIAALICTSVIVLGLRHQDTAIKWDRYKLKIPVLGGIALQQETARFLRTLGTLLRAGVPLVQAAQAARGVMPNRHLAIEVQRAIGRVQEGSRLHLALERETHLPSLALRMIAVGEEAGRLDHMLLRAAEVFEQQTERGLDRLMTLLTPLLTVFMALLVGGLLVTVMSAILSINDLAQ